VKTPPYDDDELLSTGQVAALFGVDQETATRWCKPQGDRPPRLRSVRTPGGHYRVRYAEVRALLES
jgi:excisionase family DNA binding protein